MSKLDTRITIRGSKEEKQLIDDATKRIGVSFSQYIRSLALSKDKLVFLDESGSIAKAITQLQIDCAMATRGKALSAEGEEYISGLLDDINAKFDELIEYTTQIDIDEDDKEVE
jgi:uncharacterized protein (DUF1778 family)